MTATQQISVVRDGRFLRPFPEKMQVLAVRGAELDYESRGESGDRQGESGLSADASYGLQQELKGNLKPPQPRWGVWGTLAWAGLIFAVTAVAQNAIGLLFLLWWNGARPDQPISLDTIGHHGPLFGTVTVLSTPIVLALIALAVRLSHVPFRDYLALNRPTLRQFILGLLLLVILLPVADLITVQSGRETVPDFMTGTYASARDAGPLFLAVFALALVVMAPLGEEVLFRGFLYRGLSMRLGAPLAIILTSLAWSSLHLQYEVFFMMQVFVFGLVFGLLRWWSDSVYLVVLLHALTNALAFAQAIKVTPVTV
jgi:membrane protease YdiL (CAAX protease family)